MAARAASRYARSSFPPRLEYSSLAVARLNVTFLHVSTFSTVAAIRKRLTGNSSRTAAVYYSNRGGGNWRSFPNVYNNPVGNIIPIRISNFIYRKDRASSSWKFSGGEKFKSRKFRFRIFSWEKYKSRNGGEGGGITRVKPLPNFWYPFFDTSHLITVISLSRLPLPPSLATRFTLVKPR